MAVAQPAYARQTVNVPCNAPALIAAVNAANAAAGSGTLLLASNCDYVQTAPPGTGRGPDGLLFRGHLQITGGVSAHISRSAAAAAFRVFEVAAGAVLTLRDTFVSGGLTDNTVPTNDTGGGILNSRGTVELTNVTASCNTADNGAGISNASGRFVLANTYIDDNRTRANGGGGIYNDGSLVIQDSLLRSNHANTNGGGIYNGQGGRTETIGTSLDRNTAGASGGALFNAAGGRLIHERTMIELNTAANGGGIFKCRYTEPRVVHRQPRSQQHAERLHSRRFGDRLHGLTPRSARHDGHAVCARHACAGTHGRIRRKWRYERDG